MDKTERGFDIQRFMDRNGVECSLQKSSIATEDCIWFGCNDADPKYFVPNGNPSWRKLEVPETAQFTTRMHLTQEMVAQLLPALVKFATTGELEQACRVLFYLRGVVGGCNY